MFSFALSCVKLQRIITIPVYIEAGEKLNEYPDFNIYPHFPRILISSYITVKGAILHLLMIRGRI